VTSAEECRNFQRGKCRLGDECPRRHAAVSSDFKPGATAVPRGRSTKAAATKDSELEDLSYEEMEAMLRSSSARVVSQPPIEQRQQKTQRKPKAKPAPQPAPVSVHAAGSKQRPRKQMDRGKRGTGAGRSPAAPAPEAGVTFCVTMDFASAQQSTGGAISVVTGGNGGGLHIVDMGTAALREPKNRGGGGGDGGGDGVAGGVAGGGGGGGGRRGKGGGGGGRGGGRGGGKVKGGGGREAAVGKSTRDSNKKKTP
jgi:hypothetical protein